MLDLFGLPRSPRSPAASPWTEKRLRYLRRRWSEGARAREIGAELGVTTNAVIAKIHRLGIARLSPYGGAPGRRLALQNIPRTARPQYALRRAVSSRRPRPAPRPHKGERDVENARLDAQIPRTQRRSLFALGDESCRWPVGDPTSAEFFFCGAQVAADKPYCPAHCARLSPTGDASPRCGRAASDKLGLLPPPFTGEGWGGANKRGSFCMPHSLTLLRLRGRGHTERGEGSMSSVRRGYPSNRTEMKMHQRQSATDMKTIHHQSAGEPR